MALGAAARPAAVVVACLLVGLTAFQLALALGAPWGAAAYGGAHPGVLPAGMRVTSAGAAVVWALVGLAVLRRAGVTVWAPVPDAWLGVLVWVLVGLLAVAAVLNAITPSALERALWLPTTVLLLAGTLVVALRGPVKR